MGAIKNSTKKNSTKTAPYLKEYIEEGFCSKNSTEKHVSISTSKAEIFVFLNMWGDKTKHFW